MIQEAAGSIKILMLRLESNELVFTTEPPAAVAGEVVGDVADAVIELIDPDEASDADDESASGMSESLLSAEQEAMNALAGLGFGDAMEILGGTASDDNATQPAPVVGTPLHQQNQQKGWWSWREESSQKPLRQRPNNSSPSLRLRRSRKVPRRWPWKIRCKPSWMSVGLGWTRLPVRCVCCGYQHVR